MRISDWSSDVCSSDLERLEDGALRRRDLEWPTPGAHRRATAGLRSRDGIELMLCVLDAREIVAEQSARANDKLRLDRQARRSEEPRVGKGCGSTCRYRGSPDH